jgi:trimethylamine-N-oxide reductase cytochrome c-type subunit TorC
VLKKLWTMLWQPSARYPVAILLIIGGIGGVIFWGGFNTYMEYTNSLGFCISCHEMRSTVYEEYKKSPHYANASGVRAICSDCHVPKEWTPKLIRKIRATNEVFHWLAGTIDTPEKFEAHRLEMAERVWASMKASNSHECRNCHDYKAMDFTRQHKEARNVMQKALKEGRTCIECHRGIAHKLPNLMLSFKGSLAGKSVQAGQKIAVGPRKSVLTSAAGTNLGELMPGAPLKIVKSDDTRAFVELAGWAPVTYRPIITRALGQRFAYARLSKQGETARVVLRTAEDLYGEKWEEVRLTGWVAKAALTDSIAPVWTFAAKIYQYYCDSCHVAPAPDDFSVNQWPGELDSMADYAGITGEELLLVRQYLQAHAKILLIQKPAPSGSSDIPGTGDDANEAEDD